MRGEDEDLAVAPDLEDGSAAVADVEIALAVEGDAGGDSHAFGVRGHRAVLATRGRPCRRSATRRTGCRRDRKPCPVGFIISVTNGLTV